MGNLVLNGATSGSTTVQPTDAVTAVITLPSTSGTLSVSGGSPSFSTITTTNDASISGLTVGKGGGAVATNTAVGYQAGYSNTTGDITAIGWKSLAANTSGAQNTGVGYGSLLANTTGATNSAFGYASLYNNTTGSGNNSFGPYSMFTNTTGGSNTAMGFYALYSNTTASNNTAVGYQAGYSNTTATQNTFIGTSAGYSNTAYGQHTVIGFQAGYYNVNGNINTFVGWQAGFNSNPTTPNTNSLNCFIGYYAGYGVTTGTQNTFVGGNASGYQITTGNYHTILGNFNGNSGGLDIRTNGTGFVVLSTGSGAVMAYSANGGGWYQQNNSSSWSTTSDRRIKENITPLENSLNIITSLNPVTFDYIQTKKSDVGFIAQEYQTVLPTQVEVQKGISEELNALIGGTDDLLSINQNLTPYLVKAIQELKATVDAQAARIAVLEGAK